MLSAFGGESKDKPVDLTTSPSSSDQDKSSCLVPMMVNVVAIKKAESFDCYYRSVGRVGPN